ncbi:choice-of-anchor U domain-containing protein [Vibrio renipiscarius]|uniref:thrombospondin type 3 repeat-containing protein n=1 Tax=Vibrio renipiscarius TaxID=1461322 RepID=UPI00354F8EE2
MRHQLLYLTISSLFTFSSHAIYAAEILDSGQIRFGNGSQDSVNNNGNLQQPFYFDETANQWYRLTYSSYPLDSAIGLGGDGTDEWNINGAISTNPILANQTIDYSKFTKYDGDKGYGTIVSVGTITVNDVQLEYKTTYKLPQHSAFVEIKTQITNIDSVPADNLRIWAGTRDDFVGDTDRPTKTRGNLVDGAFTRLETPADQAKALQIIGGNSGVLFFSTSDKTKVIQQRCCSFNNVMNQDPSSSSIEATNDGSYGFYVRMSDLQPGQSEHFNWFYAAGEVSELAAIAEGVAQAADVSKSAVENIPFLFTPNDFLNSNGDSLEKIKITSLPANGTLILNGNPVIENQEIVNSDFGNLTYTPNLDIFGNDSFYWQAFIENAYSDNSTLNITVDADTDGDAIGDTNDTDDDGDGVIDNQDAFPLDATETIDTDGDGIGNNTDNDDDNDGTDDNQDAFPLDNTETTDTDGDGIGNNADNDDDNDGTADDQDAFPLDNTETADTDDDGIGNNADSDDDNDGTADDQDAFPLDSTETLDTDGDGIGNNTDIDDDGDGMSDIWERQYGLNPLNRDDANIDSDNDGKSNLAEHNNESDPTRDTVAPEINFEEERWINAKGLFTLIESSTVTASDFKDGETSVNRTQGQDRLVPGRHLFKYKATDNSGNSRVVEQIINVRPLINFAKDQIVMEGSKVKVRVMLNGTSPSYPVEIPYIVTGSATTGQDHDLLEGTVVIESGVKGVIHFSTHSDDIQEWDEIITLTLQKPSDTMNLGAKVDHRVTISEHNIAPEVSLTISQDGEVRTWLSRDSGAISITAQVDDANQSDTHSYTWTLPDELTHLSPSGKSFTFAADQLSTGVHEFTLYVTDSGTPMQTDSTRVSVVVKEELPTLRNENDSDADGIPDIEESFKDTDLDGIPDYLDNAEHAANVINHQADEGSINMLESEPGTRLSLGRMSRQTERFGTLLTKEDMMNTGTSIDADTVANVGGIFDFEVHDLPEQGQSVSVVIPQRQPIPENPTYRKYHSDKGWAGFVEDAENSLASAPGEEGYCPPPGDSSFTQGLRQGDWCVRLTIQDGGPNDEDGVANGSIKDPSGVATKQSVSTSAQVSGSAGSIDWSASLLMLMALAVRRFGKKTKPGDVQ